jgi:mRNA interferase RelE/StbE
LVLKKDIPKLSVPVQKRIRDVLETRLCLNPLIHSKPLSQELTGLRSVRIGDYRVIFSIKEEDKTLDILAIGHRRSVYEGRR